MQISSRPLPPKDGAKFLSPQKCSLKEMSLLEKLSSFANNDPLNLGMLRVTLTSNTKSMAEFVEQTIHQLSELMPMFERTLKDTPLSLACIKLAVGCLPFRLQSLLNSLREFDGYFTSETVTIICSELENSEPDNLTIASMLEELANMSFLTRKTWHFSPIRVPVYLLPSQIKNYIREYMTQPYPDNNLLEIFAKVHAETARILAGNIAVDEDYKQIARCISTDLFRAIEHTKGKLRTNYLLYCSKIAFVLGDVEKAKELRATALALTSPIDENLTTEAASVASLGFYYEGFRPVFLTKPKSEQEVFDQAIYSAAEKLTQLGIFRKVFILRYEPVISKPDFLNPQEPPPTTEDKLTTELHEAIDLCKKALKMLRKKAFEREVGLFCFGLARVYSMLGMWKQARTQLESVNRSSFNTLDIGLRAAAWHETGYINFRLGKLFEADNNMSKAAAYYQDIEDSLGISAAYLGGALVAAIDKNVFHAIQNFQRAIDTLQHSGFSHNAHGRTVEDMKHMLNHVQKSQITCSETETPYRYLTSVLLAGHECFMTSEQYQSYLDKKDPNRMYSAIPCRKCGYITTLGSDPELLTILHCPQCHYLCHVLFVDQQH